MIKKLVIMILLSISLCLFTTTAYAKNADLTEIKHAIITIQKLEQEHKLTDTDAKSEINNYLLQAERESGRKISIKEILNTPELTLTPLQQFAGLISVFGVLQVVGI